MNFIKKTKSIIFLFLFSLCGVFGVHAEKFNEPYDSGLTGATDAWVDCSEGGIVTGLRNHKGDQKSINGMYCSNASTSLTQGDIIMGPMNSGSSGWMRCGTNQVLVGLRRENDGDNYIHGMHCLAIDTSNVLLENNATVIDIPPGESILYACPAGMVVTGINRVDGGDDYVTQMECTTLSFLEVCGNALVRDQEACDLGEYTAEAIGGCAADCMSVQEGYDCDEVITLDDGELVCSTICGDGILKGFEHCDDEIPAEDGDGCSANCEIENRWECDTAYGETSTCYPGEFCGNGKVGQDETCDDGTFTWNPFDAPVPEDDDGCSATCQTEYGWDCQGEPSVCTPLPVCGNGVVQGGEECDDGNTISGDSCSSDCRNTPIPESGECFSPEGDVFFSQQAWHSGDVEVEFTCDQDSESGCLAECGDVPSRHAFSSNDEAPVILCGRDAAGNIIHQEVSVNWIDKGLPQIQVGSFQCTTTDEQPYTGEWTNQDVECVLIAEDGESEVVQVAISGIPSDEATVLQENIYAPNTTINWRFTIDGEVPFATAQVDIVDCAGNTNPAESRAALQSFPGVFIDKAPPVFDRLECLSRGASYLSKTTEFSNGWTNQDVECSYSVSDPNPEFNSALSRWDTEALTETGMGGSDPWEIHETGSRDEFQKAHVFSSEQDQVYDFSAELEDAAGNVTSYKDLLEIKIDKTEPTISEVICTSKGQIYTGADTGQFLHGWTNSDVTCEYTLGDPNPEYNSQLKQWQHLFAPAGGLGEEGAWE